MDQIDWTYALSLTALTISVGAICILLFAM